MIHTCDRFVSYKLRSGTVYSIGPVVDSRTILSYGAMLCYVSA